MAKANAVGKSIGEARFLAATLTFHRKHGLQPALDILSELDEVNKKAGKHMTA
jgi:hypothetical protein